MAPANSAGVLVPRIGLAYNAYVPAFLSDHPATADYVEVPFELLCHDPSVVGISSLKPIVLHCASLSIAGTTAPSAVTLDEVKRWIRRTGTPWLGEHLSFIMADRIAAGKFAEPYAPGEPYNIGYTVSPPMNKESVDLVVRAVDRLTAWLGVPLLLENPPLYFRTPGTTMAQVEFIQEICRRCSANLLLDLTHFYITSHTMGFDPLQELMQLPLERVVEMHLSGVDIQEGVHWDDHASRAPDEVFAMLALVLARSEASAVTLEYNWSSRFSRAVLLDEIERVRRTIAAARGTSA